MRPHWHQANPNAVREPVSSAASSEGAQARHHPQPAIDRLVLDSPRLAAQRRQIDALFSPAAHRNAAMEKGATQMKAGPVAAYGSGQSRSSSVEAPAQLIRTTIKRVNGKETVAEPDYAPSQDRITRVIVRRQLLNDPHGAHWWMFFKVGATQWIQVDLIAMDGYRILLNVEYSQERKSYTYSDQLYEAEDLDESVIFAAVAKEQRKSTEMAREWRNNKQNEDGRNYHCRDFVDDIIVGLNLTPAQGEPTRIEV